jgi:predicted cupin superfamily sugar epimerase
MISAEHIRSILRLRPLSIEGGYFAESYRAAESIPSAALPARYNATPRSMGTCIYYLLTADTCSLLHRLKSDEVYHFYLGDAVELLQLKPDGSGGWVTLGSDLLAGMCVQHFVAQGVWQGARLRAGGQFALMGTTMAPGFEYQDFELGTRDALAAAYPQFREAITALTRSAPCV